MSTRHIKKIIKEGGYLAEVDVPVMEMEGSWSPVMSLDDACILDDVRTALRRGDLQQAARYGRIYTVTPLAV